MRGRQSRVAGGIARVASKAAAMKGLKDSCRSREQQASAKLFCLFRGGPRRRSPGFRHGVPPHASTRAALDVAFSLSGGARAASPEWRGAGGVDGRRRCRRGTACRLTKNDNFRQILATPGWTPPKFDVQSVVVPSANLPMAAVHDRRDQLGARRTRPSEASSVALQAALAMKRLAPRACFSLI